MQCFHCIKIGIEWFAAAGTPITQWNVCPENGTQLSGIDDDDRGDRGDGNDGNDGGCTRRVKLQVNWNLYGSIRVQIMIN